MAPTIAPTSIEAGLVYGFRTSDQDVMSAVMLGVGLLVTFFGEALFDVVVAVFGFVVAGQGSYYLFHEYNDHLNMSDNAILCVSVGIGVLGAILLLCIKKLAIFIVGAVAGAILLMFIYGLTEYATKYDELWIEIVIAVVGAILGGLLMIWLVDSLLPLVTSFIGSFMIAISTAYYIERFSDLTLDNVHQGSGWLDLAEYFSHPDESIKHCTEWCWIVVGVWALFFILGCLVQYETCTKNCCRMNHRDRKSSSVVNTN